MHKLERIEAADLISNLPDDVLCSIISLLPTKEAVATSVYSKRWRFLWKSLSRLSFDLNYVGGNHDLAPRYVSRNQRNKKLSIVDEFLSPYGDIEFFHLHHLPEDWTCSDYMLRWIELLKKKERFKGISLSCDKNSAMHEKRWLLPDYTGYSSFKEYSFYINPIKIITVPRSIFSGRFLQVVELSEYVLKDASPFKGCVNIKTLKLTACRVSSETLIDILGDCELLENLSLGACVGLWRNLSIHHKKLKLLEIHHMEVFRLYLISKSLTKLVLEDFSYSHGFQTSHIYCPNLQVFWTNNPELLQSIQVS